MSAHQDLHDLSVYELAGKLAARDISSVELTQHFLARIKSEQGQQLGAFLALDAEVSLAQAKAADVRLAAGEQIGRAHV